MLRFTGPLGVREVLIPEGISPVLQNVRTQSESSQASTSRLTDQASQALVMQCSNPDVAEYRAKWGLTSALAANCVHGVHKGFELQLQLVGVGYRAAIEDATAAAGQTQSTTPQPILVIRLGYPRPMRVPIPAGITCEVLAPTQIKLSGNDKGALAQLAARIRALRPPEPYNGKGIFVGGETIRRKEVKKK